MKKSVKNMSVSVHDRLLAQSRLDKRPFQELLQYFAMERFLYRWSKSPHATQFVLKGALMLRIWKVSEIRPTMDIDMLGKMRNEETVILEMIKSIISTKVDPDGLEFDPDSVTATRITEDAEYEGLRIGFTGCLGTAIINMQVDIGFGDIIYPAPQPMELPAMLNFPSGRLLCYSRESTIAEKFEAAVSLGNANSRMKDFYDIWVLSRQFDFNGETLGEAVRLTFHKRGTELPAEPIFSAEFAEMKQSQWSAFHSRLNQQHLPKSFSEITAAAELFLSPIVSAIGSRASMPTTWIAPGPWQSSKQESSNSL